MTRRDVKRMMEEIGTREFWELSKGAQSGSTRESRYFRDRGVLRSMRMQVRVGENEKQRTLRKYIFYQLIGIGDGW